MMKIVTATTGTAPSRTFARDIPIGTVFFGHAVETEAVETLLRTYAGVVSLTNPHRTWDHKDVGFFSYKALGRSAEALALPTAPKTPAFIGDIEVGTVFSGTINHCAGAFLRTNDCVVFLNDPRYTFTTIRSALPTPVLGYRKLDATLTLEPAR